MKYEILVLREIKKLREALEAGSPMRAFNKNKGECTLQSLKEFLKDKDLPITVDFEGSSDRFPFTIYFKNKAGNFFGKNGLFTGDSISSGLNKDWFIAEPPKPKVKRAQYLIKNNDNRPQQTVTYFRDHNDLLSFMGKHIKILERLTETEREFDE